MAMRFFFSVVGALGLDTRRLCNAPYPLIWDNDGNYDDSLAFLYLAKSSNFELRAVTLEATGMATPQGGPPNIAALARLLKVQAPIAYGEPQSFSPVATMPLQWRIELDGFFEKMYQQGILEPAENLISHLSAPDLIIKVLKSSSCPVVVLTTGPVTNLAKALERDPTVAENIHSVFMMGSAYGVASNNVYDWQMTFNGVEGSCAEDGGQTYTGLSTPLDMKGQKSLVRAGCRGVNMSKHGDTEWNVFLDARAWHMVYGFLSKVKLTVLAANATLELPIHLEEMEERAAKLRDPQLRSFVEGLAKAFLGAGEAKWWDAQSAVMMDEVISGRPQGVCQNWAMNRSTWVSLHWRSLLEEGEVNRYGSIKDTETADAPRVDYCLRGDPADMWAVYWPMVDRP